jgi:hypothetical protein
MLVVILLQVYSCVCFECKCILILLRLNVWFYYGLFCVCGRFTFLNVGMNGLAVRRTNLSGWRVVRHNTTLSLSFPLGECHTLPAICIGCGRVFTRCDCPRQHTGGRPCVVTHPHRDCACVIVVCDRVYMVLVPMRAWFLHSNYLYVSVYKACVLLCFHYAVS